jgi:hypothetical protein
LLRIKRFGPPLAARQAPRSAQHSITTSAYRGAQRPRKKNPPGVNRRAVLCLGPGRGTAGSGCWHRALTRVAVHYPLRGRIVARADQERRKHRPLPAVRSVGSGRRSHIRVGSDSGWAIVVGSKIQKHRASGARSGNEGLNSRTVAGTLCHHSRSARPSPRKAQAEMAFVRRDQATGPSRMRTPDLRNERRDLRRTIKSLGPAVLWTMAAAH